MYKRLMIIFSIGPAAGIYMFDIQDDGVLKFKISDDPALSIVQGKFGPRSQIVSPTLFKLNSVQTN